MALDTRDRRSSAVGCFLPQGLGGFENPDNTDEVEDRQHAIHWYAVDLTATPSAPGPARATSMIFANRSYYKGRIR